MCETEVKKAFSGLKERKAIGVDGIGNRILKECAEFLSPIVTKIIQKSFDTGSYPEVLKLARVVPVFKSGNPEDCTNYRPISVLTGLNKVFEVVLNERLLSFLRRTNFLTHAQYGFRQKSNTTTAAYEVVNFVSGNLDKKFVKVVSGLFLDLSKAFDLVDHQLLLEKLYKAGIRGPMYDLLKSYLTNRKQQVSVGEATSQVRALEVGVAQGSVLGPLLFLIFVNDLTDLPLIGRIYMYADDCVLFYPGSNTTFTTDQMNQDLILLQDYFTKNMLLLNETKTKCIHFHNKRQILAPSVPVWIGNSVVEEVTKITYLGLVLDQHLDWSHHCAALTRRVSAGIGAIFHCRKFLPKDVLLQLYHSFVHVHLSYMVGIWGSAADCFLKSVQIAQNRALKLIYNLPRLTPTIDVYLLHAKTILPIKALHDFQVLKYLRQTLSDEIFGNLPFEFRRSVIHLRDDFKLARPLCNTEQGKLRLEYCAPSLYNDLPYDIRTTSSTGTFCNMVKKHYLSPETISSFL